MTTKYQLYIYLSKHNDDEEWVSRYKQKVKDHNQKITDSAWGSLFPTAATPDSGFDLFMPHDGEEYDNANILHEKVRKNDQPLPLHVGVDGARALNLGVRCCMRVAPLTPTTTTSTTTTTSASDDATATASDDATSQPVSISTTTTFIPNNYATDLPSTTTTPCGFYLYPRSSISKTRMRLANSVGIIDAGYRGDLIAAVDTIGLFGSADIWHIWKETLSPIKKYDRYFQVCAPDLSPFLVHIVETEGDLSPPTDRGHGGFGSTGV
jgi:dUTPase